MAEKPGTKAISTGSNNFLNRSIHISVSFDAGFERYFRLNENISIRLRTLIESTRVYGKKKLFHENLNIYIIEKISKNRIVLKLNSNHC